MCGVNRLCHTNILFNQYRILKFKGLVDLKILSIIFQIFDNMSVPANV